MGTISFASLNIHGGALDHIQANHPVHHIQKLRFDFFETFQFEVSQGCEVESNAAHIDFLQVAVVGK